MNEQRTIRILEVEPNKRGDLFARSIEGVFLALGYEDLRFNIHKSGRELDVEGVHRAERRRLLAECKATSEKVGGDEINKFIGAVDVEKRKIPESQVSAYFVSLSGFTETAIEQEREVEPPRVACLSADRVIAELVKGRIICSGEQAAARAGECAGRLGPELRLDQKVELLAHQLGWIWCLYFEQGKQRTHFCLIHADGQSLALSVAQSIVDSDASIGGHLKTLAYLRPSPRQCTPEENHDAARAIYFKYLAADFGEIELTGLPADQDVGARRLRLENIFVPLHVVESAVRQKLLFVSREYSSRPAFETVHLHDGSAVRYTSFFKDQTFPFLGATPFSDHFIFRKRVSSANVIEARHRGATKYVDAWTDSEEVSPEKRRTVGDVLAISPRLAILAPPGGGKSTLLRRLAIAYAFPSRFHSVSDRLPERTLVPIVFRCRQLGALVRGPIVEMAASISRRAEMSEELAAAFVDLASESFRTGGALLLVDGLDEISDESERLSFANQLRIFLAIYPQVSLVVTSREPGFRTVSGALSSACISYKLAEFNDEDIKRLTIAWHKEVIGDRADVASEANLLAEAICRTQRVRELAKNPLLLTTLLLVKRWVGQLPTRRSVLYGKAIEVLLMTWNVEGHEPLNQEEVIPQLAYVAYVMMQEGIQQLTSRRLQKLLTAARQQMPEVLSFAKLSVSEFIDRVELRSSLLIQSGHALEDGKLYPVYEFRHLTFQEYLTAVAVVEGYYPNRSEQDTLLTPLERYLSDEAWKEVIPLVAVLSGRRAQVLVQRLIHLTKEFSYGSELSNGVHPVVLLGQCIADECAVAPSLLAQALEAVALHASFSEDVIPRLLSSKYGEILQDIVRKGYATSTSQLFPLADALLRASAEASRIEAMPLTARLVRIEQLLTRDGAIQKSLGSLLTMRTAFGIVARQLEATGADRLTLARLGDLLASIVWSPEMHLQFSAAWALVWLANLRVWSPDRTTKVIGRLFDLWMHSESVNVRHVAAWALSRFPLLSHRTRPLSEAAQPDANLFIEKVVSQPKDAQGEHDLTCACVAAYYLSDLWSEREFLTRFASAYKEIPQAIPTILNLSRN